MTDHFKRSLKILVSITLLLILSYVWLRHRIHDVRVPLQITLPKNDMELITYDENRHEIVTTTSNGTTRTYGRNPTVEIRKDGIVRVDAHAWGAEVRPFLGFGYSDTGRGYIGCYLLYFHSFDAGASFGWTADNRKPAFQPMLSIAWNFWSNASLNIGINPLTVAGLSKPEPAVFLSVRL